MTSQLSSLALALRRHDPDRFLTALFAPPEWRESLFVLFATNHELARAREVASEPGLALIRLHWWREVAEGARRRHEVAGPLGAALDAGTILAADLLAMIDAREAEAEPEMPTRAAWRGYLAATAGTLAAAAGRVLGADAGTLGRLRELGMAYGVAGQVHSVAALARQGRCLLPQDVLAAHGLGTEAVIVRPDAPELRPVLADLATDGLDCLALGRGALPREIRAAGLIGVFARRDLGRVGQLVHPRGLADRLAVIAAGLTGRM